MTTKDLILFIAFMVIYIVWICFSWKMLNNYDKYNEK
jgi:hypothetical protein